MLVFIDESGDPGFKLDKGSSELFVLAMVIFNSPENAEKAGTTIKQVASVCGIKSEFKFNKTSPRMKDAFFEAMASENFQIAAMVVDKSLIYSEHLKQNKERFYNFFVKLLTNQSTTLSNANIKIDGSGDRQFKQELNNYLRKQLPKGAIKKLKFEDSKKNNLIQLADMVSGAIYRAKRSDKQNTKWLDMLCHQGKRL